MPNNRISNTLRASPSPITREAIARAMSPMSFNERIDAMIRANNFNGMQLTGNVRQGAPDWRGDLQENISQRLGLDRSGRKFLGKAMNVGEVVSGVGGVGAGIADTAQASSPTERNLMGALTALSIIPGMGAVTKYAKPALKNALYRSRLGPAIEAMPMDKMTGQQAASHFSKFPGGVGSDELNYTGVQGLLTQPQVTKAGLLEQYRANPLEINDVIKGGDETKFGPGRGYNTTLPGGDDYQELLMTLPDKQASSAKVQTLRASIKAADDRGPEFIAAHREKYDKLRQDLATAEATPKAYMGGHYDEPNVLAHARYNTRNVDGDKTLFIEEIQSDWHQAGRKKGYNTPERQAELGALRSQRKEILDSRDSNKPKWLDRYEELDKKDEGLLNMQGDRIARGEKLNKKEQKEFAALSKKYLKFTTETEALLKNVDSEIASLITKMPDAPYKSTDKWQGLAFSRLVRQAADGGHDRIAWTPGKVQADRYDLSKQVDRLIHTDTGNGGGSLVAYKDGERLFEKTMEDSSKELPGIVGKDVSKKLMDSEPWSSKIRPNPMRELMGQDLSVGGEGMKSFYDKMMVKTANKFAKKYGQKVEVKSIPNTSSNLGMTRDQMRKAGLPDDEPHVWSKIDNTFDSTADQSRPIVVRNHITNKETVFKTSAEADIFIDKETAKMLPGEEVWSLKLTPEMKKDILKGGVALSGAGVAATSLLGDQQDYY